MTTLSIKRDEETGISCVTVTEDLAEVLQLFYGMLIAYGYHPQNIENEMYEFASEKINSYKKDS